GGGLEVVYGSDTSALLGFIGFGGTLNVASGGVATSDTVEAGTLFVLSGGTASATIVSGSWTGKIEGFSGGIEVGASVLGGITGGIETVSSGGIDSGSTAFGASSTPAFGGSITILAGGLGVGEVISSGGVETVFGSLTSALDFGTLGNATTLNVSAYE